MKLNAQVAGAAGDRTARRVMTTKKYGLSRRVGRAAALALLAVIGAGQMPGMASATPGVAHAARGRISPLCGFSIRAGKHSTLSGCGGGGTGGTSGSATYAKAVTSDSPVGYWRLDSSTTAFDTMSGLTPGMLYGGLSPVAGATTDGDAALNFDGSTAYASLGDRAAFEPAIVSVEAWAKATSANSPESDLVRKRGYGYDLSLSASGQPSFSIYDSQAQLYVAAGAAAVTDGKWHHLVGTYDGKQVCLYVDGSRTTCSPAGAIYYGPGDTAIGRAGNYNGYYFNGSIDDVAIYGTALTPTQVQAHFAAR